MYMKSILHLLNVPLLVVGMTATPYAMLSLRVSQVKEELPGLNSGLANRAH